MPWVYIRKYRLVKDDVETYLREQFKNTPISLEVSGAHIGE
jgi:hypothetical protein